MSDEPGYLSEAFRSVQGEGLLVGSGQFFIRLHGCDIDCAYCDTPAAADRPADFPVHDATGRVFGRLENPASPSGLWEALLRLSDGPESILAVTGGEPLLQPAFLGAFLGAPVRDGYRVLLETNSLHPEALPDLLPLLTWVSADAKLPSDGAPDGAPASFRETLRLAGEKAYAKVVITSGTAVDEALEAVRISGEAGVPVYLQPATGPLAPDADVLLGLFRRAQEINGASRLLPQVHRALGLA